VPPQVKERTPQQIGDRRLTFGKANRRAHIARQVKQATVHMQTWAAAAPNQPSGKQIVAAAASYLGYPYCAYGCRCDLSCWCHDCSGLVCVCMQRVGLPYICTSSFGFADILSQHGLVIPREQALHTPGSIAIRNPFGDSNSNGSNGHIVILVGDGTDATIEEKGTRWGCVRDHESGRGFSLYGKLPGVNHSVTPAPETEVIEPVLIIDRTHPPAHPSRAKSASIDPSGNIRLGNGAKLKGYTPKTVLCLKIVVPPSGGRPFMGAERTGDGKFKMQFLQPDLSYADFDFEFA
jgi:hypothetical protein